MFTGVDELPADFWDEHSKDVDTWQDEGHTFYLLLNLAVGGWLLVEQHLRWPEPVAGPGSDRFRVAPGDLRKAAAGLEVVAYEEGLAPGANGMDLALAQLLARKV